MQQADSSLPIVRTLLLKRRKKAAFATRALRTAFTTFNLSVYAKDVYKFITHLTQALQK